MRKYSVAISKLNRNQLISLELRRRLVTCRSFGEAEAVCVVHLWTAGPLAGHQLTRVPAAEALVLPLAGHLHLSRLALQLRLSLLPPRRVIRTGLVLTNNSETKKKINMEKQILVLPTVHKKTKQCKTAS